MNYEVIGYVLKRNNNKQSDACGVVLSLPRVPSASGTKPKDLHVFTIEECNACKLKKKRDFAAGDYIAKVSGKCEKCGNPTVIILIYGEEMIPPKRGVIPFR